jgi:hypothetical protein
MVEIDPNLAKDRNLEIQKAKWTPSKLNPKTFLLGLITQTQLKSKTNPQAAREKWLFTYRRQREHDFLIRHVEARWKKAAQFSGTKKKKNS